MATSSATVSRPESTPGPDCDTIIIGAGISGLYQLYCLRKVGQRVRVFEAGTGVGGTWYWNRYPGCRFDSESYSYGYSFSHELLDEWDWTEHFAPQTETERYLNYVADKFDLRRDIQLRSRVRAAVFDEAGPRLGDHAGGWPPVPLALPRHRGWPALRADHASDRGRRRLRRRGLSHRTLAQASRHVRREARGGDRHRRDRRAGHPGDRQDGGASHRLPAPSKLVHAASQPFHPQGRDGRDPEGLSGPVQAVPETAACFVHTTDPRNTFEVSEEERIAFWERLYASPGFEIWMGNFRDMLIDRAANTLFSDFVASKIRERVKDPEVAERLIPKDHGFGTRRVPQETHYYEVYNQPNVELVSILDTPIERITRTGLTTSDRELEFDVIVYATGFDAITGSFDRIDIRGQGGQRLKDKWTGGPSTFLGVMVDGFPNMFMVMGPHTALGNIPRSIEYNVEWIRDLLGYMDERGLHVADARREAVDEWTGFVKKKGEGLLVQRGRLLDDGRQHERRGQARPHHCPLQRHGARIPRMVRPRGRGWLPGIGAGAGGEAAIGGERPGSVPHDLTFHG